MATCKKRAVVRAHAKAQHIDRGLYPVKESFRKDEGDGGACSQKGIDHEPVEVQLNIAVLQARL